MVIPGTGMKAEEIILQVYKHKKSLEQQGKKPERIVLTKDQYDMVQAYHRSLGDLPSGVEDYLGRYTLFGIPIYIDGPVSANPGGSQEPQAEAEGPGPDD